MNPARAYCRELLSSTVRGWQRFWFLPADPATLGVVRIAAGAMLFYTHLVWSLRLEEFFGPHGWISPETAGAFFRGPTTWTAAWSYFWLIESPWLLWTVHVAALVAFAALTLGFKTRAAAVLSWIAAVSYANRAPMAMFGLDQINVMLALYLMVGPSGDAFSLDRWLAKRRAGASLPVVPSVGANVAVRLMQVHMCIIYLFAGTSKLSGETWWDGSAMWFSIGNLEYQSVDVTFLVAYPLFLSFMTHATIAWEVSYCFLVWPRLTRPLVLAIAVPLHMGIAVFMGMITFGLAMLIGNSAFVSPELMRQFVNWGLSLVSRERAGMWRQREVASLQARGERPTASMLAGRA